MSESLYRSSDPHEWKNLPINTDIRQKGYSGKKKWMVINGIHGALTVYAADLIGAIYTAGTFWGERPQKADFHQSCRVVALG